MLRCVKIRGRRDDPEAPGCRAAFAEAFQHLPNKKLSGAAGGTRRDLPILGKTIRLMRCATSQHGWPRGAKPCRAVRRAPLRCCGRGPELVSEWVREARGVLRGRLGLGPGRCGSEPQPAWLRPRAA
jgi:hypothetical protein